MRWRRGGSTSRSYGATVALGRIAEGIVPGQPVAVTGKRARIRLRKGESAVTLELVAGGTATIDEGDSLRLVGTPEVKVGLKFFALPPILFALVMDFLGVLQLRLRLLDRDGAEGTAVVTGAAIERVPAEEKDEEVSEIAFVGSLPTAVTQDRDRTTLTLSATLAHCYDRASTRVNANVARATHGETVNEVLGSGDARQPDARFALRQFPLTHVSAATPTGRRAELAVRANDLLWKEVPSLYARGPAERAYEIKIDDDARASVLFGDGVEGARLPSGDHNVRATYRKGLGLAGNVAAAKITNLLSRPLGVTGASNPSPATGGEDPETTDQARTNAPLTVLTLERAVSIRDYRDFARAFAGIAKAHALWIPSGPARGVFLTVAGERGAAVPESSDTFVNLEDALHLYGDPLMPLVLKSYRDARFRLRASVKVAEDADAAVVLPEIETRLRAAFGFDARSFGQGVSVDEVSAAAHGVAGVVAVHVTELHRTDTPSPALVPRIFAALPVASLTVLPLAAELLTLDAAPLTLDLLE